MPSPELDDSVARSTLGAAMVSNRYLSNIENRGWIPHCSRGLERTKCGRFSNAEDSRADLSPDRSNDDSDVVIRTKTFDFGTRSEGPVLHNIPKRRLVRLTDSQS